MTWRPVLTRLMGHSPRMMQATVLGILTLGACVGLGKMGDAGVHGLADDEAEVYIVGHDFDTVVAAALKELESRGEVVSALLKLGVIRGSVKDADVTIRVDPPQRGTIRVDVQARGDLGLSPRKSLASAMARSLERRLP